MTRILMFVAALLVTGCVTKGSYNELKAEYEQYKARADERERVHQQSVKDLEDALAAERTRLDKLTVAQAKLDARLAALKAKTAELTADKAALLKDKSRLKATEAEMTRALSEMAERKAQTEARVAEYRDLLSRFRSLIDSGKLRVKIIDGQMVVQLATDILFTSGSAVLSKDGEAAIVEVTGVLAGIPERAFQVAGHTDDVPISNKMYRSNWELAFGRAMSVVRTMVDSGMPSTRISATSYAEFKPAASNDDDEGKAANRRIEILVVPDLSKLPGAEELERLGEG